MRTLDISTLFVATIFVVAALGLSLVVAWIRDRGNPVLLWWGGAILLGCSAYSAFALQGAVPDVWSIDVGAGGLLGAIAMGWGGVRYFEGRSSSLPLLAFPLLPWVAAAILVPDFPRNFDVRVPLFSTVMVSYTLLIAHEIWRGRAERLRSRPIIIGLLLAHAAWFTMRGLLALSGWVAPDALAQGHLWLALASFERLIFAVAAASLALSLVKEREEMRHRAAARIDPLTGAGNRRAFAEALAEMSARDGATSTPVALLLFDLDSFKAINDTWGHSFGDRVLRLFAENAGGQLRAGDLFTRLGGEEFAAVIVGAGRADALTIAERIRADFAEAGKTVDGKLVGTTVSIGVATRPSLPRGFDEMFDEADRALYLAKAAGRNRVRLAREVESKERTAPLSAVA